jgi:hypothetical protein
MPCVGQLVYYQTYIARQLFAIVTHILDIVTTMNIVNAPTLSLLDIN